MCVLKKFPPRRENFSLTKHKKISLTLVHEKEMTKRVFLRYTAKRVGETSSIFLRRIVRKHGQEPATEKPALVKQALALQGEPITLPTWIPRLGLPKLLVPGPREGHILRDSLGATAQQRADMIKMEQIDRVLEEYGIEADECSRAAKMKLVLNLRDENELPLERVTNVRLILRHDWKSGQNGQVSAENKWLNDLLVEAVQQARQHQPQQSQKKKPRRKAAAAVGSSGSDVEEEEEEEGEEAAAAEDSGAEEFPSSPVEEETKNRKKRKRVRFAAVDSEEKSVDENVAAAVVAKDQALLTAVAVARDRSFLIRVRREIDYADLQAEVERTRKQFPAFAVSGKVLSACVRVHVRACVCVHVLTSVFSC